MRVPDEQSLPELIFQMVIGAFDSAILMSNTTIITRRLKAIMLGEISKASCEAVFTVAVVVGSAQAVCARFNWYPARLFKGFLEPLRQSSVGGCSLAGWALAICSFCSAWAALGLSRSCWILLQEAGLVLGAARPGFGKELGCCSGLGLAPEGCLGVGGVYGVLVLGGFFAGA